LAAKFLAKLHWEEAPSSELLRPNDLFLEDAWPFGWGLASLP
jgi:hypothetical protein